MTDHYGSSPVDEADVGIGAICRWWVSLEHLIHDLALHAAQAADTAFDRDTPHDILHLALSNMSMSDKVRTADALIFRLWGGADPRAINAHNLLHKVDQDHRPARNRCVHSMWDDGGHEHLRLGAKVDRVKGSEPTRLRLTFNEPKTVRQNDVLETLEAIQQTFHQLVEVDGHLAAHVAA